MWTGGAERPLASTGLEGGVLGVRVCWEAAARQDRWLADRVRPGWRTGGSWGRWLVVLQERLGESSGDESSRSVVAGVDILGRSGEHQRQDASGPRLLELGLIKGRLSSSAGLAL